MTSPRAEALLRSPTGLELFHLIEWRQETSLTDQELMARAIEARSSASVYRGDHVDHLKVLRAQAPRYESRAECLAARMERWWAPLDRGEQVWVHRSSDPPSASGLVTDLTQFSVETPKPKHALWTCTLTPVNLSPWLDWPENLHRQGSQQAWMLGVSGTARVAEVHSPEDWWELAHAYPAKTPAFKYALMPLASHPSVLTQDRSSVNSRLDPDWQALAHDLDGVHVSMAGVMTAEDVAFERDGVVTELRGWDVESTVWFTWVFDSVKELDVHG
jgi:hypothetical protein